MGRKLADSSVVVRLHPCSSAAVKWRQGVRDNSFSLSRTRSAGSRLYGRSDSDALDLSYLPGIWRVHGVPEIPVALPVEPKLRRGAEQFRQTERRVGRYAAPPIDNLIDPRIGHVNPLGEVGLSHSQRLEKLFKEHLAGMCGRSVSWQGCHNEPPTQS